MLTLSSEALVGVVEEESTVGVIIVGCIVAEMRRGRVKNIVIKYRGDNCVNLADNLVVI